MKYNTKGEFTMEEYVTKVGKASDFNPEKAISDITSNAINQSFDWARDRMDQKINAIMSHANPVAPPQCMKLFSGKLEEVTDMRHFLYNKGAGPIGIIYIHPDAGYLYNHFNEEQMQLYKSDNAAYGLFPHDPGLFYASYVNGECDNIHEWKSVSNEIINCLSKILYWIKFSELTGIELDLSNLSGPWKRMYDMIKENKDDFMSDYHMIVFGDEY